jgi:hypothetical protein
MLMGKWNPKQEARGREKGQSKVEWDRKLYSLLLLLNDRMIPTALL